MNKKHYLSAILFLITIVVTAQFHTLNIPQSSPGVIEKQKLGVTEITINYSSPALNGRDVWNSNHIIPHNGTPIPWRAGANMNTTISFSTDVTIDGNELKAGTYGFHIIPTDETFTLLFAHNNNQWGSYYLDIEKDVTLKVDVESTTCTNSKQLDYEFLERTENSVVIGLEWGEKRIPFTVSVDLNKTVVESFRSELRGINTYHWQAWNDAANWCLNHNTNLEEALVWVNRSIDGGFYGFAANKNITNISTKIKILNKLGRTREVNQTIADAKEMIVDNRDAYAFGKFLLQIGSYQDSKDYSNLSLKKFPDSWSILLNRGVANYFLNNPKAAVKDVKKVIKSAPKQFINRLNEVINEFESGTYKLR